jgi:choline dehydrogenase-like flavoprotein
VTITGNWDEERHWQICIVGAGPVGIALALECEKHGLSVIVIEAGDLRPDTAHAEAEIYDGAAHAPIERATARAFGGTSWLWGGRCVPFDPLDFRPRGHVLHSGWPISHADVEPFYGRAAEYLGCGNPEFEVPAAALSGRHDVETTHLERWSAHPRRGPIFQHHFKMSEAITLVSGGQVVEIELDATSERAEAVVVATQQGRRIVQARWIVLAAGGLGTTRLLLSTQRYWPRHFGGIDGALGRFYMGHLTGQISYIKLRDASDIDYFDYCFDSHSRNFVQRRFTISESTQLSERLLNTAFWLENPPFRDPAHENGVLSLIFLALAMPPIGNKLVGEAIRTAHVGHCDQRIAEHIRNVVKKPGKTATEAIKVLVDRYKSKVVKPSFIYFNQAGVYALRYHAEHAPDPVNRVVLGEKIDRWGLPCLRIKFGFADQDATSIVRAHEVLDRALQETGTAQVNYCAASSELTRLVMDQATDGYHHIGTTRMGLDPRTSVVDPNCRVHDVDNLFIASSSVFCTSSQANPTLLATALAARLADHIRKRDAIR